MTQAVEWILTLVDRVSAPSRTIENRLNRIQGHLAGIGRGQDRMGRGGEDAARRMDRAYQKTEGRLGRLKTGMLSFAKVSAGIGLAATGVGAVALGRAALGGMSGREGNLMSLGTLLKGQTPEQVKDSAGWINKFADVTPFEDSQVMASVKQLLAARFSFDQTKGIANITGNAASALGSDTADAAAKWQIINRALGQIKSKGRVQGDELLQLQEAGIGTDAYLEKYVGKNYREQMQKGQLSANVGISAILSGLNDDYGGAMDKMSTSLSGLMSTLVSRPQRILGQMFDEGGLTQAKAFMVNLVNMTDFSKPPGDRILKRLSGLGANIMNTIFGPLAAGTSGDKGIAAIDFLLDKLDQLGAWWATNGPAIVANARGVWEGLKGAWTVMQPLLGLLGKLGGISVAVGGDSEDDGLPPAVKGLLEGGVLGKALGFVGGLKLGMEGLNAATFGASGMLLEMATGSALGLLGGALDTLKTKALGTNFAMEILTHPGGKLAGLKVATAAIWAQVVATKALGLAALSTARLQILTHPAGMLAGIKTVGRGIGMWAMRFSWIARLMPLITNPIGIAVLVATALAGIGTLLYRKWEPFRNFVDGLADGFRDVAQGAVKWFMTIPDKLRSLGGAIYDSLFPPYIRDLAARVGVIMPERSAIDPNYVVPYSGAPRIPNTVYGGALPLPNGINGSSGGLFAPPTIMSTLPLPSGINGGSGGLFAPPTIMSTESGGGIFTPPAIMSNETGVTGGFKAPTPVAPVTLAPVINLNGPATPQAVQDIGGAVGNVLQTYSLENGYGGATP